MPVNKITTKTFEQELLDNKVVLVDCSAEWCAPCKAQKPILEKFAEDNLDIGVFVLDIEDSPEIAQQYKVSSIPAFLWFVNGKLVNKEVGLKKAQQLAESLAHARNP